VLSGTDPTVVLARASVPPLPYTLPWEAGVRPTWPCNTRHVSNLGGVSRVIIAGIWAAFFQECQQ